MSFSLSLYLSLPFLVSFFNLGYLSTMNFLTTIFPTFYCNYCPFFIILEIPFPFLFHLFRSLESFKDTDKISKKKKIRRRGKNSVSFVNFVALLNHITNNLRPGFLPGFVCQGNVLSPVKIWIENRFHCNCRRCWLSVSSPPIFKDYNIILNYLLLSFTMNEFYFKLIIVIRNRKRG